MSPKRLNSAAFPPLLQQRSLRAKIAEPEHRRPVGDYRDAVPLDRQPAGVLGFFAIAKHTLATPGV